MASQLLLLCPNFFPKASTKCPFSHHFPRTTVKAKVVIAPKKESHTNNKSTNIVRKCYPFFKVLEDGTIERFAPTVHVPPLDRPDSNVRSKDVYVSSGVSARIFMPRGGTDATKLPLIVYYHGGGLSSGSAFGSLYHDYMESMVASQYGDVMVVSVEYRLAPEHPVPACYDDSFQALRWVASHAGGDGPDAWLNRHADFRRVFLVGDSAGANIAHNVAVRVGYEGMYELELAGMALVHPYFAGVEHYDNIWFYICPENEGMEDPRVRPGREELRRVGCERVVVFVAGSDRLRHGGTRYLEELNKSGWGGEAEVVEHPGEGHVFHLVKPQCHHAVDLMTRLLRFVTQVAIVN